MPEGLAEEAGRDVGVGVHENQEAALGGPRPRVASPRDLVHRLEDDERPRGPGDLSRPVRGVVVADHDFAPEGEDRHGRREPLEGGGKQGFLVVGGDDDGVVWPGQVHHFRIREKPRKGAGGFCET